MKKIIYLLFIYSLFSFKNIDTSVYVYDSTGAKKCHFYEPYRGLGACKHQIVKTTQSKARDITLTLTKRAELIIK